MWKGGLVLAALRLGNMSSGAGEGDHMTGEAII